MIEFSFSMRKKRSHHYLIREVRVCLWPMSKSLSSCRISCFTCKLTFKKPQLTSKATYVHGGSYCGASLLWVSLFCTCSSQPCGWLTENWGQTIFQKQTSPKIFSDLLSISTGLHKQLHLPKYSDFSLQEASTWNKLTVSWYTYVANTILPIILRKPENWLWYVCLKQAAVTFKPHLWWLRNLRH